MRKTIMVQQANGQFWVCLFAATSAWYVSAVLAACLGAFHTALQPPEELYRLYWPAFFDEYRERLLYFAVIAQSVLFGFALRFLPPAPPSAIGIISAGAVGAILTMPLAAMGVFGIAIAPEWPALSPPMEIPAGYLWCLPGLAILAFSLRLVMLELRRDAS